MTTNTSTKWFLAAVATALFVACALAHGDKDWPVPEEARKRPNPIPVSEQVLQAAKADYEENCVRCHGDTGKGDGGDAMMYDPQPADLSDAHMMNEMTDGEIFYKISEGRKPMPSFKKGLTEEQRWQLVHYVRTFSAKPKPKTESKPASKPPAKKPAGKTK